MTLEEAQTLEAWVDALIPPDASPGAAQAGVAVYIDRQLTRTFKRFLPTYRQALREIDEHARQSLLKPFHALDLETRTTFLAEMESGPNRAVFEMILAHTMQGFYGDPRHGGNREYASWQMIGVPPMPIRGRQQYDIKETFPRRDA